MTTGNSSQEATTETKTTEVSTATQSAAPETTTTAEDSKSTTLSAQETAQVSAQAPVPPAYTPNFKFKVFDKEFEMDKTLHPLIKGQEIEAKIRDLYTKAYAMDGMKEDRNKVKKDFETFRTEIDPKIKTLEVFNTILQNKDWDTFFTKLGVPDEEIFAYVEKKLGLMNAPAEQRAEYERQLALKQQHYAQSQQLSQIQSAYQQQAVQTRTMQLDALMARPDVMRYATSWDEKNGTIGAFRQLIIDEASSAFYQTGRDLSAEEAVNQVVQKFGKLLSMENANSPMGQSAAAPQMQSQQTKPPVIPAVAGRGTSPVKKVPKSLDDLKKLAAEMAG